MASSSPHSTPAWLWTLRILIPLLILSGGYWGYKYIKESRPKPQRTPRPVQLQVIEAQALELTSYPILLNSQGTVRPAAEAELSAEVSGRVVWVSKDFREGNIVKQGTELLRLESADYQTEVILAESELARVQATWEEEQARAERALSEWQRVRGETTPPPLAIREPQLKQAQAAVQAAEASLSQAKRDFERTTIRAPWDAFIRSQAVDVGQFVNRGAILGELFESSKSEVWLPLSQRQLALLDQERIGGSDPLTIQLRSLEQGVTQQSTGQAMRLSAELDEATRQQFLIVEVSHEQGQHPLRVNAFVEAEFQGITLENVYILDPTAVRESLNPNTPLPPGSEAGKVYLVELDENQEQEPTQQYSAAIDAQDDESNTGRETKSPKTGRLYSREVTVLWRTAQEVVIRPVNAQELQQGELICLTNLQRIPEGQAVNIRQQKPAPKPEQNPAPEKLAVSKSEMN